MANSDSKEIVNLLIAKGLNVAAAKATLREAESIISQAFYAPVKGRDDLPLSEIISSASQQT